MKEFYEKIARNRINVGACCSLEDVTRFEKFIELMKGTAGNVLDVGCGEGNFASFLGAKKYDYYGVDIAPTRVRAARNKGLKVACCDLDEGIPFKDKTFDVVIASEIIEHLPNVSKVLREIHRVLKDDGFLIGSVPNATNISSFLGAFRKTEGGQHFYSFSRPNLEALLKMNGFAPLVFTGDTFLPISKVTLPINKQLGEKLSFFAVSIIFKARKIT